MDLPKDCQSHNIDLDFFFQGFNIYHKINKKYRSVDLEFKKRSLLDFHVDRLVCFIIVCCNLT